MALVPHSNVIPRLAFHLAARGQEQSSQAPLTKAEAHLHKVLQKAGRGETPIGAAVKLGTSTDNKTFRKLVCELKDQLRDGAGNVLENIIGREGIEALRNA